MHKSDFFRSAGVWALSRSLLSAIAVLAMVGSASAGPASPGEDAPSKKGKSDGGQEIETDVSAEIVSDYVPRGFSLSSGRPSIQGEIDVFWKSFYAGAWFGSVNFGGHIPNFPNASGLPGRVSSEIEFNGYVGYQRELKGGVEFDAAIFYVAYGGVNTTGVSLNYWEFKTGVTKEILDKLKLGVNVYYSPNYEEESGNNWIFESKLEKTLPVIGIFTPSLSGSVSYQVGDTNRGGFDYGFYDVGMSFAFHKRYTIDFRYHDTFNVPFDCLGSCSQRVVAGLKAEF
jgi:uncharacterized protein (TIGR02001 family)